MPRAGDGDLRTLVRADPAFAAIDAGTIDAAFDVDAVAARAGELAIAQLDRLAARAAATGPCWRCTARASIG